MRWPEISEDDSHPSVSTWSSASQIWSVTMNLCLGFSLGAAVLDIRGYDSSCGAMHLRGKMQSAAATAKKHGPGGLWRDSITQHRHGRQGWPAVRCSWNSSSDSGHWQRRELQHRQGYDFCVGKTRGIKQTQRGHYSNERRYAHAQACSYQCEIRRGTLSLQPPSRSRTSLIRP